MNLRRDAQQTGYSMPAPAAIAAKSASTSPLSHPPVAHKAKLLPGGERFRRGLHRFQTASERRVVFAVPRGIRRAGGARRGRIASVREILPEDGLRPAVRADRAGGGIKILREPLENAAETGERFRRFRRRRRLRRQLRGDRRCDRRSRRRRGRARFKRQPRRRHRPREEHERQTNDDNSFFHCFLLSESVYPAKPFPSKPSFGAILCSSPSVSTVTP